MSPVRWSPASLPLSLLNVQTNVRYQRCLREGKHRPGFEVTKPRMYAAEYVQLPICQTCRVPVTGKAVSWNLGPLK